MALALPLNKLDHQPTDFHFKAIWHELTGFDREAIRRHPAPIVLGVGLSLIGDAFVDAEFTKSAKDHGP